jgi:SAM-dependent methyltransferase/glycosyltransferase involved in cell wall biosynthesis
MRLHWFSPLPPAKTDIAAYTIRLLSALQKRAEVVLWTDQVEWDTSLAHHAIVRRYQPEHMPWAELNRGDMSIYHIGNDRLFHGAIWQVSRSYAGIVVLHDLRLHNFFAGLYCEQWNDHGGYVAQMARLYGQAGRQDAEAFWRGRLSIDSLVERYPLTPLATEKALGVLVHSKEGLAELRQQLACPVVYAPLPYSASPYASARLSATQSSAPPYRLIVFGYIYINRRLEALLQALAGLPEREQFRLDIYGQLWDSSYIREQIKALGLCGLVTLHGFVPKAELDKALTAADLAVNLRYPTMGEASGSQLQIWDYALPSLVTRVGWYAHIPEDVVAFVRPEHEIRDIQAHLRAFLANPHRFAQMGARGRRILEEQHTPEAYAQALVELAAVAQRFSTHAVACELAHRVAREMRGWMDQPVLPLPARLSAQVESVYQPPEVPPPSVAAVDPQQIAALEAMRQAVAECIEQLRQAHTATLEAIRQTVAAYVEQLDSLPNVLQQEPPQEPYHREQALRFPLSAWNHDVGFRYLFDFMVVAKSLDLRPGAEVFDFASGSGYISELLNRLGYSTVAFDLDPTALAIGRERLTLDPRCDRALACFVVGDGTCLPFAEASFDGIICMNALHHMPDYRATLAEMYRVLRPGGRAVFSEPGAEHSKHPESINMMKEFGVLERDVIVSEIAQLAKEVGFRRMVLKPFVSPEYVNLDYEEFALFRAGKPVSAAYVTPQEIATYIERDHPLFYLEKPGERPLTSATAAPELLRARITLTACPHQVRRGERMRVVARCENTGRSLWLSQPRPFGGYVTFGIKLLTRDGRLLDDSRGRQLLPQDVPPGSQVEVAAEVSLEGLVAGWYRVLFDMVNEQVHWFQHKGSEVAEQLLEIV